MLKNSNNLLLCFGNGPIDNSSETERHQYPIKRSDTFDCREKFILHVGLKKNRGRKISPGMSIHLLNQHLKPTKACWYPE